MTIFQLNTNEGTRYVQSTQKRMWEAHWKYLKEKKAQGYSIPEIMFSWGEIHVGKI